MNRGVLVLATAVLLTGCANKVDLTTRNWTATAENCPNGVGNETRVLQAGMRSINEKCVGLLEGRAGLQAVYVDPNRTELPSGGFILNVGEQKSPYIEGETSSFSTDTVALVEMQQCVRTALKEAEEGTKCKIRVSEMKDETHKVEIE